MTEPLKEPALDPKFLTPFVQGVLETFQIQCQMTVTAGTPLVNSSNSPSKVDLAAVAGLIGMNVNGSIALCFPAKMFLETMSQMLGQKEDKLTSMLESGAVELLNVCFGKAKRLLNQRGYALDKTIPFVMRGENLVLSHHSGAPVVTLPFTTQFGAFYMQLVVEIDESRPF
jgi:chemotaxis protein CheX